MSRPSFWKGGNWQQTSLFRSPFLVGSNKHEICWGVNWSLWASPRWTKSLLGVPVAMYQRCGNAHVFWYRQNRHTEKRLTSFFWNTSKADRWETQSTSAGSGKLTGQSTSADHLNTAINKSAQQISGFPEMSQGILTELDSVMANPHYGCLVGFPLPYIYFG